MDSNQNVWAEHYMVRAESFATVTRIDRLALSHLGSANSYLLERNAAYAQRAMRVVDAVVQRGHVPTIRSIALMHGHRSETGDECGAALVLHASIARNVFSLEDRLASRVGLRTLRALLRAGADPNCVHEDRAPLEEVVQSVAKPGRDFRIQKAAMLIEAGAHTAGFRVSGSLRVPFLQLCDLRALSTLCAAAVIHDASSPSAWFVRRDGDSAIAHRVHAFLAPPELLVPQ
jgi:hypothetical protein